MEFATAVTRESTLVVGGLQPVTGDEGDGFNGAVTLSLITMNAPMTYYEGPPPSGTIDPDALCTLINAVAEFIEHHAEMYTPNRSGKSAYDGPLTVSVKHIPAPAVETVPVEPCES